MIQFSDKALRKECFGIEQVVELTRKAIHISAGKRMQGGVRIHSDDSVIYY